MTEKIKNWFKDKKLRFLVTGAAGFVGTNLALRLLELGQSVTGIDSFITGRISNIEHINNFARENGKTDGFKFIKGDLNDAEFCKNAAENIDYVFHEAAIEKMGTDPFIPLYSFIVNGKSGFISQLRQLKRKNRKNKLFFVLNWN